MTTILTFELLCGGCTCGCAEDCKGGCGCSAKECKSCGHDQADHCESCK